MSLIAGYSKHIIIGAHILTLIILISTFSAFYATYKPSSGEYVQGSSNFHKIVLRSPSAVSGYFIMPIAIVLGLIGLLYWKYSDSKYYRILYIILFTAAAFFEVYGTISGFSYKSRLVSRIGQDWYSEKYRVATKSFEYEFGCCGFNSTVNTSGDCGCISSSTCVNTCEADVRKQIGKSQGYIGSITLVVLILQVLTLGFGVYMAIFYKNGYTEY